MEVAKITTTAYKNLPPIQQALTYYNVLTRGGVGATFFCHKGEFYGQYCTRDEKSFKSQYFQNWNTNNCYMPLNLFSGEYRYSDKKKKRGFFREECDVTFVNGMLIDFDIMKGKKTKEEYTIEKGDALVEEVLNKIDELVKENKMVTPTLVTRSGRGVQMIVLYKEPISIKDEEMIFKHKRLYVAITTYLQSLFDKDYVEVDTGVKDASRICRLPGTKHLSNNRMTILQEVNSQCYYDVDELCGAFGVDLTPEEKKKPGRPKKEVQAKPNKKKNKLGVSYALKDNVISFMSRSERRNLEGLSKSLEKLAKVRGMEDGDMREVLLFVYYCVQRQLKTGVNARSQARTFNNSFGLPLEFKEVEACLKGVDEHRGFKGTRLQRAMTLARTYPNGFYKFTRDTVVEKLSMSEEEIEATGIYKRRREKERARVNNSKREECMSLIIRMLKNGESEPSIVSKVMKNSGKSRATAYRWITKAKDNMANENSNEDCENSLSHFGVYHKEEEYREDTKGAKILSISDELYNIDERNTGELMVKEALLPPIRRPNGTRVETLYLKMFYNDASYWEDHRFLEKTIKTYYDVDGNITQVVEREWKKCIDWQQQDIYMRQSG